MGLRLKREGPNPAWDVQNIKGSGQARSPLWIDPPTEERRGLLPALGIGLYAGRPYPGVPARRIAGDLARRTVNLAGRVELKGSLQLSNEGEQTQARTSAWLGRSLGESYNFVQSQGALSPFPPRLTASAIGPVRRKKAPQQECAAVLRDVVAAQRILARATGPDFFRRRNYRYGAS